MLGDIERIALYSIMASLCEFKIKYNGNINISFDFINSIYALSYKFFSSKRINLRLLRDVRIFKNAITNEFISNQLASLDSSFNCVFNANSSQCEDFINKFETLTVYKKSCVEYMNDYIVETVYKVRKEEKANTNVVGSSNVSIEPIDRIRLSENELLSGHRSVNKVVSARGIENITLNGFETLNKEIDSDDNYSTSSVIYSSSEGKAIIKTLKKDI